MRALAIVASVGVVWTTAAGRAAERIRLPATAVVRGAVLVQGFGCTTLGLEPFDPYCPTRHFHSGIDLASPSGTPVYAATDGAAITGFDAKGAGLFVSVTVDQHVRILYCHLRDATVFAGRVVAGGLIGHVGSSGLATGPHLHLEVQVDGRSVDPIPWLAGQEP
jgi:murein DD-endopeptidase MepM/ murein hydrolase activator NlpD